MTDEQTPDPSVPATWVHVEDLVPWAENPRKITRAAVSTVARSIKASGWGDPVVLQWPTRQIVSGHTRRLALFSLLEADPTFVVPGAPGPGFLPARFMVVADDEGDLQVGDRPCRWASLEEAEDLALNANRSGEIVRWEPEALAAILARRREAGSTVDEIAKRTAFGAREIAKLLRRVAAPVPHEHAKAEESRAPESQRGEVYQLGPHLLYCGDSLQPSRPGQVPGLGGELVPGLVPCELLEVFGVPEVDVSLTDPPYAIYGSATGISSAIADDLMVRPFFRETLGLLERAVPMFGAAYVFGDWRSWPSWWEAARGLRHLAPKNLLVWDKGGSGLGSNWSNGRLLREGPEPHRHDRSERRRDPTRPRIERAPRSPAHRSRTGAQRGEAGRSPGRHPLEARRPRPGGARPLRRLGLDPDRLRRAGPPMPGRRRQAPGVRQDPPALDAVGQGSRTRPRPGPARGVRIMTRPRKPDNVTAGTARAAVLRAVLAHPGRTAAELARLLAPEWKRQTIMTKAGELVADQLLRRDVDRRGLFLTILGRRQLEGAP